MAKIDIVVTTYNGKEHIDYYNDYYVQKVIDALANMQMR